MTTPDTATRYTHQINEGPRGTGLSVRATASWKVFVPASPAGQRPDFDPERAGRRAVDRHGDALRRLAE